MATPFSSSLHYIISSRGGNTRAFDLYHNSVEGRSFLQEPLTLPIKRLAALPAIQTVLNMDTDSPQRNGDGAGGNSSWDKNVRGQVRPPIRRTYATEMLRARPAYLPAIDEDQEEGDKNPKTRLTKTKSLIQAPRVKTTRCTHPPAASRPSSSSWQDNKGKTSSLDFHNQSSKLNNKKATATKLFPEDDRKMSETKGDLNMATITANPLANLQSRLEISLPVSANQSHGFESLLQQAIKSKEERAERKRKSKAISTNSTSPASMGFGKILPNGQTVWISHVPSRSSSYAFLRAPKPGIRIRKVPGRKIHRHWKMDLPTSFEDTWSQYATVLSGVRMSHFGIENLAQSKPDMEAKQDPALKAQPELKSGVESELARNSDADSESNAEEQTEDMAISKLVSSAKSTNNNPTNSINVLLPGKADPITIHRVGNPIRAKQPSQKPEQTGKKTGNNPDVAKGRYILNGGESSIDEKVRLEHQAKVEDNLKSADPLLNRAELTLLRHPDIISDLKYHDAVLPREGGRTSTSPRQGERGQMIWRGKAGWCAPVGKSPLSEAWTPDEMKEEDERWMKPVCLGTEDCMCWDCDVDMMGF